MLPPSPSRSNAFLLHFDEAAEVGVAPERVKILVGAGDFAVVGLDVDGTLND